MPLKELPLPIYEYTCRNCGKEFEELVFGDDRPACPFCGSDASERLMSRACVRRSGSEYSGSAYEGGAYGAAGGG